MAFIFLLERDPVQTAELLPRLTGSMRGKTGRQLCLLVNNDAIPGAEMKTASLLHTSQNPFNVSDLMVCPPTISFSSTNAQPQNYSFELSRPQNHCRLQ